MAEILVLLIEHDGDDSPAVALARNRAELLEQVKVAVWGAPHPDDTTNDAGDDMAEGMTDELLRTGVMRFEGDKPLRLVRIPVEWSDIVGQSRCANCGKPAEAGMAFLSDYPEEGEWFCSEECKDQHDELGCPHETHDGHRHPVEARRLIEAEGALRSLASWLGAGGFNAPTVDAKVFEEKIRWGVDDLLSTRDVRDTSDCGAV